jgi:DNA repair photolyase
VATRKSNEQPDLFQWDSPSPGEEAPRFPIKIGHATATESTSKSILTKASGFMAGYDYTLNPYSGCSYGCTYCYAAFFARDLDRQATWGQWVEVKTRAVEQIERMRTDITGARVYMSSVTDPYQPIERRLGLVRDLLPVLRNRGVRLVVQTRSPLVTRDIAELSRFEHVRVNMTVTTDDRRVQQAFEPHCPTNERRLRAITEVAQAGINCSITMTPLLPLVDPAAFARRLLETGVQHFVVQPFHATRGRFVAGTGEVARAETRRLGWDDRAYRAAVHTMRSILPVLEEGQDGFRPV